MARENPRTWGAPAGRALLPTAGCAPVVASGGAERSPRREQEAPGVETAPSDSLRGSDPGGRVAGIVQTAHRFRTNRQLWTYSGLGIEVHSSADHQVVKGQAATEKEADRDPRTEQELQSPSEEFVQGCRG